jgi:hypothetical protein
LIFPELAARTHGVAGRIAIRARRAVAAGARALRGIELAGTARGAAQSADTGICAAGCAGLTDGLAGVGLEFPRVAARARIGTKDRTDAAGSASRTRGGAGLVLKRSGAAAGARAASRRIGESARRAVATERCADRVAELAEPTRRAMGRARVRVGRAEITSFTAGRTAQILKLARVAGRARRTSRYVREASGAAIGARGRARNAGVRAGRAIETRGLTGAGLEAPERAGGAGGFSGRARASGRADLGADRSGRSEDESQNCGECRADLKPVCHRLLSPWVVHGRMSDDAVT